MLSTAPWPWYVAGALIGLVVPALQLAGGKQFGISSNFRHLCAFAGARLAFFQYDWRKDGAWNLVFASGLLLGGWIAATWLGGPNPVAPAALASWPALVTWQGVLTLVGGGLLVGFGARWAGGCTSGHAIAGLASAQLPSLLAVLGFFAGGLVMTHVILPWVV